MYNSNLELYEKRDTGTGFFCELCEFLKTPFLQNTLRRLRICYAEITFTYVFFSFESFTCLLQPTRSADTLTRRIEKPCFSLPTENVKYTRANRGVAKTVTNI